MCGDYETPQTTRLMKEQYAQTLLIRDNYMINKHQFMIAIIMRNNSMIIPCGIKPGKF